MVDPLVMCECWSHWWRVNGGPAGGVEAMCNGGSDGSMEYGVGCGVLAMAGVRGS